MVIGKINPTGLITFWSLSEYSNREKLMGAWSPLGLGKLVPEPRPAVTCLKDAMIEVVGSSKNLVRPLASRTGFVVVNETRGTEENQYQPRFSARVTEGINKPLFSIDTEETRKVEESFYKHLGRLRNTQVTAALVAAVSQLGGTRLRPSGGIYWLAGDRLEAWEQLAAGATDAAEDGQNTIYLLKHDLDASAVTAVKDAIVAEIEYETNRLVTELREGDLGRRAVESRKREAAALRDKVSEYESILNVGLEHLRKHLDAVDQTAALSALLLAADLESADQEDASGKEVRDAVTV
jgi:hypothetical protein